MFTGIIEELGEIEEVRRGGDAVRLSIRAEKVIDGTKVGDSIDVNGVCLTVVEISGRSFRVDVVRETMKKTALRGLRRGDRVNLERALRVGERVGGHFVTGHVDGVGKIVRKGGGIVVIEAPAEIIGYVFQRASIAVDGISLTVQNTYGNRFEVAVIPHTALVTTLGFKGVGASVNLEVDMLSKQVETSLQQRRKGITREFLSEKGFTE